MFALQHFFCIFAPTMTKYNTHTLPNGLRIIHLPSPSPIVYCGYQVAAGTRNEEPGEEGLAHFCEHVSFKGTSRRSALQIINHLERVGGELNAYTNKDTTVFYAALQQEHLTKAVDLLSDIVFCSTYPQQEIDKEVEVICDEIESYNDSPAELIYDEFENTLFKDHPLGHNILGTAERVRSFTTADAKRFTDRYYTPDNSIFFCYGDVEFPRLVRMVDKYCSGIARKSVASTLIPQPSTITPNPSPTVKLIGSHQAHVMIGSVGYDIHDSRRMALYLLNNILGGPAMNSRLNLALRERNGLVYTVESTMVSYADTGLWSVYFGCDPTDVNRCLRLVRKELDKLMSHPLTDSQLRTAKQQLKGQLALACDNRESFALDFGKSFLHYGWEKDITALYSNIDRLTSDQLQQVACHIFDPKRISTLIFK